MRDYERDQRKQGKACSVFPHSDALNTQRERRIWTNGDDENVIVLSSGGVAEAIAVTFIISFQKQTHSIAPRKEKNQTELSAISQQLQSRRC